MHCQFSNPGEQKRFPVVLRIWWGFYFSISCYCLVIDIVLFKKHVSFPSQYLVSDVLSVGTGLFLCIVGFFLRNEGEDTLLEEPLLNEDSSVSNGVVLSKEKGGDTVTPYSNAGIFSILTFSWMGPLIAAGNKKPLDLEDVPQLDSHDSVIEAFPKFKNRLQSADSEGNGVTSLKLVKALFFSTWKDILWTALFAFTYTVASYVGPYLIDTFVQYLNGQREFKAEGYLLVAAFFVAKLVECLSERRWFFKLQQVGLRQRAVLVAMIYNKGLTLSCQSKQSHTSGEIINFMTVDAERVGAFSWYMHDPWMVVMQVALALLILYKTLGLASIVTFIATILEVLLKNLRSKTVIYVTHQVEFLPAADLILVMKDGRIVQAGKYNDILNSGTDFMELVGAHKKALSALDIVEASSVSEQTTSEGECDIVTTNGKVQKEENQSNESGKVDDVGPKGQLVQEEEREKGQVGFSVYWKYSTTAYGGALVPLILLAQILFEIFQIGSNYWMAWGSPMSADIKPPVGSFTLIMVYLDLAIASAICVFARSMLLGTAEYKTATLLFKKMHLCIFRAPMSFFDSTPSGRILNRASTDQSAVDMDIAHQVATFAFSVIQLLGIIAVMSQVSWQIFIIFIPVIGTCIWYQKYYISSARELSRLVGVCQAPVIQNFAETILGATTIRSFDQEKRFQDTNMALTDSYSHPKFYVAGAMEWLCFRLDLLSSVTFAFSLFILISLPEGVIDPAIAGLAVTYGLNLNILQAWVVWTMCNMENKIISVERILQYCSIPSEPALVVETNRPDHCWPYHGEVHIRDLQVRYAPHMPLVLRGLTCTFPGGLKTGIVGRTGSGKSTLIQTLFRIIEPAAGQILIDGVNISSIRLHDLRSRLSIIPQEPTMFEGTIRSNLDPLEEYTDEQIWEALDKCQLGDGVRNKAGRLDSSGSILLSYNTNEFVFFCISYTLYDCCCAVSENGENWSMGQRQLVCLGRVLLKKSKILVLDEATASVDTATDNLIQTMLREHVSDCTVITIAHRITSVLDSDMVLLLRLIEEYDSPSSLLENKYSSFAQLVAEYTMRSNSVADDHVFGLFSSLTILHQVAYNVNMSQQHKPSLKNVQFSPQTMTCISNSSPNSEYLVYSFEWQEVLLNNLRSKTVIYVTHQVEFLPAADLILVMKDGRIVQAGKYNDILNSGTDFMELVGAHKKALSALDTVEASLVSEQTTSEGESDIGTTNGKVQKQENQGNQSCKVDDVGPKGQLVQEEEREKGQVGFSVYWKYITTAYGGALVPLILLAQILFQIFQIGSNYWMAWASPVSADIKPPVGSFTLIMVYLALAIASAICVFARSMFLGTAGYKTATLLFKKMHLCIFRAPMSFFDSTPSGRILNRASTDQSAVDMNIAYQVAAFAFAVIQLLGIIAVMSQVAWQIFIIFIPVIATCIWYQQYYISSARELSRLVGVCKAPVIQNFAETILGATTIRSFDQEKRFQDTNMVLTDSYSRPKFHVSGAMEWLCFRLDLLSSVTFAFSLFFLISIPEGIIDPAIAGLAVTYGLNLNMLLAWVVWNSCSMENKIISVERILQYCSIPSEPALVVETNRPDYSWPFHGEVHIRDLQVRYAPHMPLVLRGLTCTFPGGLKTGIVGRTGSGKSTLIQTLFRIVEPAAGLIIIDGVNISSIGLHDLRSRLSIIPQEPTMFEGTIRSNLDPLEEYTDEQIWEVGSF
ncbi:hypothetical protein J1N35_023557 [Gossypium stocksii]|uniref:ABC-type xenobiotic transporter n=1 Tax=Gossypium stocksii TaxID=47602 RepID=A0A9D4A272_9ROSI|nr:hypothetical protein J1N35_023557 [Gossypium stocksii]